MKTKSPNTDYYRKLKRRAATFRVDLDKKQWCDLWHTHFDWDGFGDQDRVHRRRHVKVLLNPLAHARRELATQKLPYQLFALIHPNSSADDALYVHTPNPNGVKFPCDFGGTTAIAALPPLLAGLIDFDFYTVVPVGTGKSRNFAVVARNTIITTE